MGINGDVTKDSLQPESSMDMSERQLQLLKSNGDSVWTDKGAFPSTRASLSWLTPFSCTFHARKLM